MTARFSVFSAPTELTVTITGREGVLVLTTVGDIDAASVRALDEALVTALAGSERVIVDLSRVEFLGCAGIRVLCVAAERHPSLTVVSGTGHGVRRCLEITDAGRHLTIHETLAAAISPARNEESTT
ncbi:STAS domain-containing protein [Amycolatopsis saalfeldensis]|uniref:Anti-anti-sigma factor n=1 Tax=Amycolatopsis saalfeldensis TaxID=394193 RepID=A0A1H8UB17_9PSEU|nr:STAS domain-containing protein [Amycolatopsis saalfeldensis]SEP00462.1 anti-anti-sigma factor [Amycolatopsis saalfeldensis]